MACGTKMIPTIIPDIKSPQMYSLSLYFGSQRTTGKNPVRVDRTFGPEQVKPFFSFDLITETAGCGWRTRRSKRSGWASGVSVSGETSSMVLTKRRRRQCGEKKEKVQRLSAVLLEQKIKNWYRNTGLMIDSYHSISVYIIFTLSLKCILSYKTIHALAILIDTPVLLLVTAHWLIK